MDYESGEADVIYETAELIEDLNWTSDGRIFRISLDGQRGPERINTILSDGLNNKNVLISG